MTSILTNVAAMAALQTLRSTNYNLEITQARVSSGLRVEEASHNAAYWSIATTMRSDNMALSAVQDALGLGAAKVDTAYAGMESAIDLVGEIKAKLVAATEDGVDKTKIQEEITQLQQQLISISEAASFSGENWLQTDLSSGPVLKTIVGSFVRDSSGAISVKKINYSLNSSTVLFDTVGNDGLLDAETSIEDASVTLNVNVAGVVSAYTVQSFTVEEVIAAGAGSSTFDGSYANDGTFDYVQVAPDTWVRAVDQAASAPTQEIAFTDSTPTAWAVDLTNTPAVTMTASVSTLTISGATTASQMAALLSMVDDAFSAMTSAASSLGSVASRIETQELFVSKLTDSIDAGIGRLVDADLNEESSRLRALQTQQQLGIQSLTIANSTSENILQLFRN